MADPSEAAPVSDGRGAAARSRRVAGAAGLTLIAVLELLVALDSTTRTYLTPSPRPGAADQHTVMWAPGVLAAAVAALAVLTALGWLVWHVISRPPARLWWVVGGLVLVAGVWTAVTSGASRPNF